MSNWRETLAVNDAPLPVQGTAGDHPGGVLDATVAGLLMLLIVFVALTSGARQWWRRLWQSRCAELWFSKKV